MKSLFFIAIAASLAIAACSPKFYLVDRQTVLEDEAAGEWPDFEKQIIQGSLASEPTPFPTVAESAREARLYNILNGELASTTQPPRSQSSTAKTPAPASTRK